jgi:hypothetical protein
MSHNPMGLHCLLQGQLAIQTFHARHIQFCVAPGVTCYCDSLLHSLVPNGLYLESAILQHLLWPWVLMYSTIVYVTTLSVSHTACCRIKGRFVNNELERIWKEAKQALSMYYPNTRLEGMRKHNKDLCYSMPRPRLETSIGRHRQTSLLGVLMQTLPEAVIVGFSFCLIRSQSSANALSVLILRTMFVALLGVSFFLPS